MGKRAAKVYANDSIIVYSNGDAEVLAKYLTYKGALVYSPYGSPYIVAKDFSFEAFIEEYQLLDAQYGPTSFLRGCAYPILVNHFRTSGPDDLQRSYNGQRHYDGDGFVEAFTPVASFVFGVSCYVMEVFETTCEVGGGVLNLYNRFLRWDEEQQRRGNPNVDIGNIWGFFNNPHNVPHIEAGYTFADYYCRKEVIYDINSVGS